jgi:DEAD/DEAH box helicase domain-containing protein
MKNIVYFDLETKKSAQEVGGWGNIHKLGLSIGVTYSTADEAYHIYTESQVDDLVREILRADLVVGFNHVGFDYRVLQEYTLMDLTLAPHLDLMVDIQKVIQKRISLDSIATATFGAEKTAEGLQAVQWYKEGKMYEIAEYCCYDVKITKLVHEFGMEHKAVFYKDRFGKLNKVAVDW